MWKVKFEVVAPEILDCEDCHCSICTKSGYLHLIVPTDNFSLLQGEEYFALYAFNTKVAKHCFCKICGIKPFYVLRSNPDEVSVNVYCIDGPHPLEIHLT